ncbi:S-adenosyl-l-methionine hydroxide adenosyltransferase family protein [Chloroflexota bacterium]
MSAIVTLTTDFGLVDAYVAVMKGVILSINPEANLVDICHNIKAQNIPQAAFVLSTAYQFFPMKTIHLVVVDPGVGTKRRAIILKTPSAIFVAPDNGVLSYIIQELSNKAIDDDIGRQQVNLESELEAVAITKTKFSHSPVSTTFHGRDIFAPVAALLSLGFPPIDFGETINSINVLPVPHPYCKSDGTVMGNILHVDIFGNLITNIKQSDLSKAKKAPVIEIGKELITGLSHTYADGVGMVALMGSSGYLEISLKGGNANNFLSVGIGHEVKIRY